MFSFKITTSLALAAATLLSVPELQAQTYRTAIPSEGYTLVWHDEFDGEQVLDRNDWDMLVTEPGRFNSQLQYYTDRPVNGKNSVEVVDGTLRINCFKEGDRVCSGRLYCRKDSGWHKGIFEARIRLPKGKGTHEAFWMLPVINENNHDKWPRGGEVDILEVVGFNPNYTTSSIHCEAYNHRKKNHPTAGVLTPGADEGFHVYTLEWTDDCLLTYVDGKQVFRYDNDGKGDVSTWPFNKPFFIVLSLAWGGEWAGSKGIDESALPTTMEIDYIRVFQKQQ